MAIRIAFDGIDRSGKETQSRLTAEWLEGLGYRVLYVSFPRYSDSIYGKLLHEILNPAKYINPRDRRDYTSGRHRQFMLYAMDRSHFIDTTDESEYDFIIFDRFDMASTAFTRAQNLDIQNYDMTMHPYYNIDMYVVPVISADESIARGTGISSDLHEKDRTLLGKVADWFTMIAKVGQFHDRYVMGVDGTLSVSEIQEHIQASISAKFL